MKQEIINELYKFLTAEYDNDMIGICKSSVDWLKVLHDELNGFNVELDKPERYYKMDPHLPRMDLRENARKFLSTATKYQKPEIDYDVKLKNLFMSILGALYVYHMPVEQIYLASKDKKEFTRKDAEEMLLKDNMSPNWIKESSGKDFSALFS